MTRGMPKNKSYASLCECGFEFREAVEQELIMAEVAMRVARYRCEKNDDRSLEGISRINRDVEGGSVNRSLRPLHPIHDDFPVRVRTSVASDCDTRVGSQLFKTHFSHCDIAVTLQAE